MRRRITMKIRMRRKRGGRGGSSHLRQELVGVDQRLHPPGQQACAGGPAVVAVPHLNLCKVNQKIC